MESSNAIYHEFLKPMSCSQLLYCRRACPRCCGPCRGGHGGRLLRWGARRYRCSNHAPADWYVVRPAAVLSCGRDRYGAAGAFLGYALFRDLLPLWDHMWLTQVGEGSCSAASIHFPKGWSASAACQAIPILQRGGAGRKGGIGTGVMKRHRGLKRERLPDSGSLSLSCAGHWPPSIWGRWFAPPRLIRLLRPVTLF